MDEERTADDDLLQVAQHVKFPVGLEQSSVVHPAALSPYWHPTTSHWHQQNVENCGYTDI